MTGQTDRKTFENLAAAGADGNVARGLGSRLKAPPQPGVIKALAALWLHSAVAAPERTRDLLDAVAEGYLGEPVTGKPRTAAQELSPEPIPEAFWTALWDLVDAPRPRQGSLNLVSRNAALAALLSPKLTDRAAKSSMALAGVAAAFAQGYPRPFSLEALARCSKRSVGGRLYESVAVTSSDLAVLDRETLALDALPPPLPYLYARTQQCHRLWQIVGGYGDTALHEAAILGFQLAQCGHPRAALRLGTMFTLIAFERPEGAAIMMRTLLDAWIHGLRTPSLLGVNWPAIWNRPVEQVRAKLGITPFVSAFPADLFERIAA